MRVALGGEAQTRWELEIVDNVYKLMYGNRLTTYDGTSGRVSFPS